METDVCLERGKYSSESGIEDAESREGQRASTPKARSAWSAYFCVMRVSNIGDRIRNSNVEGTYSLPKLMGMVLAVKLRAIMGKSSAQWEGHQR